MPPRVRADQKAVRAVAVAVHDELRKHDGPLRVDGAIGDPVLLRHRGRRVDLPLVGPLVKHRGGLHLHRVVAVALRETPRYAPLCLICFSRGNNSRREHKQDLFVV